VEPVFPYGLVFPRTVAGTTLSGTYGKIYIIGDSLLDGTGSTQGVVEEKIAEILSTTVVNNAVGGFPLEAIAKVPSCSQDVDCKWTIINGGINRDVDLSQVVSRMTGLVEREVATGRKVILQGYPRDCPEAGLAEFISGDFFEAMHDAYVSLAAGKANVWMVDSRNHPLMGDPCNPASRPYRAEDNSHPSPLAGQVFAEEAIKIIMANLDEATLAPVSLTPVSLTPVSLTPSSLLLCSESCANAFTFGCMPYHCEQGQSIDEAWTTCRGEIDDGLGPLAEEEVGCIPGCGNTVTMSMAFECGCDNIDQCESDEGTPDDEEGDDGDEVEPVFPYGLVFPRTVAGTTLSGTYGKIYIIGDSLLDGTGSTQGVVEEKIAEILSTTVVNNAVGGFPLEAIAKVPSCSQDVDCKWTIINGGINRDVDLSQVVSRMTGLVEREVATGRKVILQGYPRDCPEAGLAEFISGDFFEAMHDAYVSLAAGKANVWMVDSRNHPLMGDPCNPASRPYRAEDNSHPSPLAGQVFAEEAIKIIMANLDEATLAPVSLTPVSLAPVSSSSPTPLDEENEAVEEQGEVTSQPTMQGIGPLCLSGDSTVHSLQRGTIPLSMVQLGESIFVGNGKYEPVYSFGHFGPNVRNAKMLRISTDSGTIFSISENHLIFTETNEAIPASQLTVGSRLQSSDHNSTAPSFGVERIKSIQNILSNEGVYAPFTPSGKFVVGGTIVVSCYVAMFERLLLFNHHWLAHIFTFPRRLACFYNLTHCQKEEYTADSGIALWIAPYFDLIQSLLINPSYSHSY